jgi:hypothetical protein
MNPYIQALIAKHITDPSAREKIAKEMLWDSRKIAIILGSFLMIAIVSIAYGFIQHEKYKMEKRNVDEKIIQLDACMKEAEMQQALAVESRMIAEEANRMAVEQLKACQAKSKK